MLFNWIPPPPPRTRTPYTHTHTHSHSHSLTHTHTHTTLPSLPAFLACAGNYKCDGTGAPKVSNNTWFTPSGTVTECGKSLPCSKTPSDDAVMAMATAKLGIN